MPHDDLKIPQLIPQRADEADALAGPPAAVSEPLVIPPAPLPVAPWWASSTPDPTPPESVTNPPPPPATLADPVPVDALVPEPPAGPAGGFAGPVAVAAPPQVSEPLATAPAAAPPQEPSQALDALVAAPPAPEAPVIAVEPLQAPEPVADVPLVPPPAPEPPPAPPAAPETLVDRILSTGPQPAVQAPPPARRPDGREDPAVRDAPPPLGSPPPPHAPARVPAPSSARRPRSALLAGLAVGAGVAVTALAAVLVAVSGKEDVPVRTVAAAGTAGGLRKDAAMPATSAAYPFMLGAARAGGVERAATAGGVYRDPTTGAQDILFLGGTAPIGDPVAFLAKARPSTALTVTKTAPGKGGGKVSCGTFAVLAQTHLYCAWATENSFGFVASNEPAGTGQPAGLAPLTDRMRADLEKRSS
ncbi:hypothetical protein GCM10023085_66100 [Actinomadura viridis]|uniref:Uncharacterized protein n=1 Tax=Actinomadura viridis TaxID=58110 RepID=A0A931DL17_9ACTN|nr:hypothetical protein [Actinomadura viridis]MBG6091432.1 hypothetical protein [Actinomadura viridis]